MNGLEKSIHELINRLVYEATTRKSEPSVLVGEASTSKAKGKGARRWKRKKGKGTAVTATDSTGGAPPTAPKGKGKGKVRGSQQSRANDVCIHCQGKGHWKRECPQLLSHPGMFVVEINMISNSASWVLDTDCGAHICNDLQVLQRSRKLSKDEMILRLGDGKAVAVEAVGSLSLVVSNHVRIELKDCYYVPSMGHALETVVKLLNTAPSKSIPQTPYEIWHGKPASYKYLRVWGSPAYVKRLVGDKLDLRSSLCSQLNNDPKTYGEAMPDIDSGKWLEAMKSKMDSMGSNEVWTLVDPPKGVRPVGCKWVYKRKLVANGEVTAFKARLVAKGYTQRPGVDFEETYLPVAMAKSIRILLAIAA
ncbi:UNVERIFIED_CONTAM: Retrovirus-related Pol polyprotein from transposon RE2 [Sesamum radiatum]|uniref:Retrovirus-related Pol polyprotein from transposon RE2 n=1 Tax=Sesamum radiatum TaxID=300843 RepID=A0AAW2L6B9_SESRA